MLPLALGALIGAAVGVGKQALQKSDYKNKMRFAADYNRYSPWTGLKEGLPTAPDLANNVIQGAATGAMMGAGAGGLASGAGTVMPAVDNAGGFWGNSLKAISSRMPIAE